VSSIEANPGSDEVNGGQGIAGRFVVASGDGTELLESGEEVFNQVVRLPSANPQSTVTDATPSSTGTKGRAEETVSERHFR